MPEGDEVRRTARGLDRALAGTVLTHAELRWPEAAGVDLTGRTWLGTAVVGKHLLTRLDDGRTLRTHLRMDGRWRLVRTPASPPGARPRGPWDGDHTVRAVVGQAEWTALGESLGMLDVLATRDEPRLLAHLGPDVLAEDFPAVGLPRALERWAARPATPVAEMLLDQTVQCGIGTIWTAEPLFVRRVWPWIPAGEVDAASLLMVARELMTRSLEHGPQQRWVHGRLGERCRRCGRRIEVGTARRPPMQRPVFWCPGCQPSPGGAGLSRRG